MDATPLYQAYSAGDAAAFLKLLREDETVLDQRYGFSSSTALHLAVDLGDASLVEEVLKLRAGLVSVADENSNTPVHEACRGGDLEALKLLLAADPEAARRAAVGGETPISPLQAACRCGRLEVVKYLLQRPGVLESERDRDTTALHVAALEGQTEVVIELLKASRSLARSRDVKGRLPIHMVARRGYVDITREFLKIDPSLCSERDGEGWTPVHVAVKNRLVGVLDAMLSVNPESARVLTVGGQCALHLAVSENKPESVRFLVRKLEVADLNRSDRDGNNALHLAVSQPFDEIMGSLVRVKGININALNHKGQTPLDIAHSEEDRADMARLLQRAGGNTSAELDKEYSDRQPPPPSSQAKLLRSSSAERFDNVDTYREGIWSTQNTVIVVATLIASVTYSAGINPPHGKPVPGADAAFKVFVIANNAALFSSLAVVLVLVSVIPHKYRPLRTLLAWTHKGMWVSVVFMQVAYLAATWMAIETKWVVVAVMVAAIGMVGAVAVGLAAVRVHLWLKKRKGGETVMTITTPHPHASCDDEPVIVFTI